MAKLALALPFEQVRMGECPCPIQAIVLAEQACWVMNTKTLFSKKKKQESLL